MFCVRCGQEGKTYESLCMECFLANNKFTKAPEHVDLFQCYHCQEFLLKNRWVKFSSPEEAVKEAAVRSLEVKKGAQITGAKLESVEADVKNHHVHMQVTVEYGDLKLWEEQRTTVRLKNTVCPRCSKMAGNYYESIVQIRGRERKLSAHQRERMLNLLINRVNEAQEDNREMFISKLEDVPGGIDAYLSSISLAKSIAKELADMFGAEVKDSSTLVTQKEGKDVYRVTYLVRLPSYMRGEIIQYDRKPWLVQQITSTTTKLLELKNHEPLNVPNAELREVKLIGKCEDILEAVVLTDSRRELQLLHPKTYATVEIKKPQQFTAKGETVRVFMHEEEIYLLPN